MLLYYAISLHVFKPEVKFGATGLRQRILESWQQIETGPNHSMFFFQEEQWSSGSKSQSNKAHNKGPQYHYLYFDNQKEKQFQGKGNPAGSSQTRPDRKQRHLVGLRHSSQGQE